MNFKELFQSTSKTQLVLLWILTPLFVGGMNARSEVYYGSVGSIGQVFNVIFIIFVIVFTICWMIGWAKYHKK